MARLRSHHINLINDHVVFHILSYVSPNYDDDEEPDYEYWYLGPAEVVYPRRERMKEPLDQATTAQSTVSLVPQDLVLSWVSRQWRRVSFLLRNRRSAFDVLRFPSQRDRSLVFEMLARDPARLDGMRYLYLDNGMWDYVVEKGVMEKLCKQIWHLEIWDLSNERTRAFGTFLMMRDLTVKEAKMSSYIMYALESVLGPRLEDVFPSIELDDDIDDERDYFRYASQRAHHLNVSSAPFTSVKKISVLGVKWSLEYGKLAAAFPDVRTLRMDLTNLRVPDEAFDVFQKPEKSLVAFRRLEFVSVEFDGSEYLFSLLTFGKEVLGSGCMRRLSLFFMRSYENAYVDDVIVPALVNVTKDLRKLEHLTLWFPQMTCERLRKVLESAGGSLRSLRVPLLLKDVDEESTGDGMSEVVVVKARRNAEAVNFRVRVEGLDLTRWCPGLRHLVLGLVTTENRIVEWEEGPGYHQKVLRRHLKIPPSCYVEFAPGFGRLS